MTWKRSLATIALSTALLLACSGARPQPTTVDSPDSWAEAQAASTTALVAVAGFESAGTAASSSALVEPAPSPEWEVTEGHLTLVSYGDQ